MDLCFNSLSALPDDFSKLTALHTLNLANNKLSALPDDFSKLTALHTLDLRFNSLHPDIAAALNSASPPIVLLFEKEMLVTETPSPPTASPDPASVGTVHSPPDASNNILVNMPRASAPIFLSLGNTSPVFPLTDKQYAEYVLLRRGFAIFERDPLDKELKGRLKDSLGAEWIDQVRNKFPQGMRPFIDEAPVWSTYVKLTVINWLISSAALGLDDAQRRDLAAEVDITTILRKEHAHGMGLSPVKVVDALRALEKIESAFVKRAADSMSPFNEVLKEAIATVNFGNGTRAITADEGQALAFARALQLWEECVKKTFRTKCREVTRQNSSTSWSQETRYELIF